MIRWLRLAAKATATLAFVALGILIGLFLVANGSWVPVDVPPWLAELAPQPRVQVWLPALIAGWLVATLALAALLLGSMYYVWRRRQYEALVGQLERELARLRNLPLTEPSPLEDLPEAPSPGTAAVLAAIDRAVALDDDAEAAP
ncbi:MAG: hypothetical protein R3B06_21775 [Kofleriaceae bacterium]